MNRLALLVIAAALAATACTAAGDATGTSSSGASTTEGTSGPTTTGRSFAGVDPAPEFPDGLDWLNTDRPLSLAELRGKVVLLDFWTYGCINCIHIIPDLERLEAEFEEELVVIGVHSAKFTNEGDTDNIRQIILRYGIEHPVVNDRDFEVWRTWGANAWPTVVIVDPAGNIVGGHSGEGVYDVTQPVISSLVAEFSASGRIDTTPVDLALEADGMPATILSFPGKVLADPTSGLLYIADSNHHRIVAADPTTGDVADVFGSSRRGFLDGDARTARFDQPQGMALSENGSTLYVADTSNHAVRAITLATGEVTTVVGTGAQSGWPPIGGIAPAVDLASPWDLAIEGDTLYIAMAGTHQIWGLDLATGVVGPVVGNGRESTLNGSLTDAELAQPSGLAFDDAGRLLFADSESSSIRFADFAEGFTGVLAGSDANLFEFGLVDGVWTDARFQHPLGVAVWSRAEGGDGTVFVADTYNSAIRRLDPSTLETTTFAGGTRGWADGDEPLFYEPGGLDIEGSTLYVADTNNHAVRIIDLPTGETSTLVLKGIERFAPTADDDGYRGTIVETAAVLAPGDGGFVLDIRLPPGYKVNDEAPSSVTWTVTGDAVRLAADADRSLTGATFPVAIDAALSSGGASVVADLTVIYCEAETPELCLIEQVRFVSAVTVADGAVENSAVLGHEVTLPTGS